MHRLNLVIANQIGWELSAHRTEEMTLLEQIGTKDIVAVALIALAILIAIELFVHLLAA